MQALPFNTTTACSPLGCRQHELRLRPERFAAHLRESLGFHLVRQLGVEESAAGFDRPLLLLRKPTHAHAHAGSGQAS